jgi:Mg2+-importing ATPase
MLHPDTLDAFWNLDEKSALQILSCTERGLSRQEAEDRLKIYGPNSLKGKSHSSPILLFLSQFKSPITILLIAAAFLSMAVGDTTDAVIILSLF